MTATKIKR